MKTQFDWKRRVVSLENLNAMCDHISGMAHRYWVESVSRSRVRVGYSDPDEWGNERPIYAVFPCYPTGDQPAVVLDIMRVLNNAPYHEGWQCFQPLLDCPTLWRDPTDMKWRTHRQIRENGRDYNQEKGYPDSCVVCDLP